MDREQRKREKRAKFLKGKIDYIIGQLRELRVEIDKAADIQPQGRPALLREYEKEEMARLYEQGELTIREIGQRYGVSHSAAYYAIRSTLKKMGHSGNLRRPKNAQPTENTEEKEG